MDNVTTQCLLYYWWQRRKSYRCMPNKRKYNGRIWVRPIFEQAIRRSQGAHDNLLVEMKLTDRNKYFNFLRMSPDTFDKLLKYVQPVINKPHIGREPLPPSLRLELCLRYLASGDSMVSLSYLFRVGVSTTSCIIRETCEAIWTVLRDVVFQKPTNKFWSTTAEGFQNLWNFPNCVGAIDGKHVVIQAPQHSGSSYYNYKGSHSVVILATCDANYNFTTFETGFEGRQGDGGIFSKSVLGKALAKNALDIPPPTEISRGGRVLPFVFVGDEAFPLSTHLMRPFPGRDELPLERQVYNYRLSRARRTIENTFGIWVARWRIFRKPIIASPETVDAIIKATVCLHNFIKEEESINDEQKYFSSSLIDVELNNGSIEPGEWRNLPCSAITEISSVGSRNFSNNAREYRESFVEYLIEEGRVEWQWKRINR